MSGIFANFYNFDKGLEPTCGERQSVCGVFICPMSLFRSGFEFVKEGCRLCVFRGEKHIDKSFYSF